MTKRVRLGTAENAFNIIIQRWLRKTYICRYHIYQYRGRWQTIRSVVPGIYFSWQRYTPLLRRETQSADRWQMETRTSVGYNIRSRQVISYPRVIVLKPRHTHTCIYIHMNTGHTNDTMRVPWTRKKSSLERATCLRGNLIRGVRAVSQRREKRIVYTRWRKTMVYSVGFN